MEFKSYKQGIIKSANNILEELVTQLEAREQFYEKLLEQQEINHRMLVQVKEEQINELVQVGELLKKENKELKEAKSSKEKTCYIGFADDSQKNNNIMEIRKEDYDQLIDDIQKAYIIESERLVEYCLNDLVQYSSAYKVYIKIEDFWSVVFIAYLYNRDKDIIEAYGLFNNDLQDNGLEAELYKKLLKLHNPDRTLLDYKEAKQAITDNHGIGLNVHAYIKNELLEQIEYMIEQLYTDFIMHKESTILDDNGWDEKREQEKEKLIESLVESNPSKKQEEDIKVEKSNNLYSLQQINRAVKMYVEQENWKKLEDALKYLIKNHEYYQPLFEYENLYDYLVASYIFGYDDTFIKRFNLDEEILMENRAGYSLYCMLKQEKDMVLHTIQLDCSSRFISRIKANTPIFNLINKKYIVRKITPCLIPYVKKVWINEHLDNLTEKSNRLWHKSRVFILLKGAKKVVLIEAWRKQYSSEFFISSKELSAIQAKIGCYQLRTKGNINTSNSLKKQVDNKNRYMVSDTNNAMIKSKQPLEEKELILNNQSILKTMGYDTKKSKEERWRILNQIAVPKLGKQRVVGYLKFFIKLHKSKTNMASAIKEWEYDLKRLGN